MISPLRFFGIVIAALMVTSLALHAGGVFINASGCELRDLRANEYLSACSHPIFQDYEHGALFYDLEPPAGDRMRKADVIFLGSSRTQAGWHTEALERNLSQTGISFYMLGFGFDEKMTFPKALIERQGLHPKVVVINADPFFVDKL